MPRQKVLTVKLSDLERQTFRSGGPGGQNQNKRDTGVRLVHRPSGAVGESREERTQLQNQNIAFKRLAESHAFWVWAAKQCGLIEEMVDQWMRPENLRFESYTP